VCLLLQTVHDALTFLLSLVSPFLRLSYALFFHPLSPVPAPVFSLLSPLSLSLSIFAPSSLHLLSIYVSAVPCPPGERERAVARAREREREKLREREKDGTDSLSLKGRGLLTIQK